MREQPSKSAIFLKYSWIAKVVKSQFVAAFSKVLIPMYMKQNIRKLNP